MRTGSRRTVPDGPEPAISGLDGSKDSAHRARYRAWRRMQTNKQVQNNAACLYVSLDVHHHADSSP
jgi:hypothetical protein